MSLEYISPENRRESNVPSLEKVKETMKSRIRDAREDLDLIAPALRSLAEKIEQEKPDALVFLDISARIFGTPYLKYLRERMGKETPNVSFLNDNLLKAKAKTQQNFVKVANDALGEFSGKKVFFVDETYSNGKGALAIIKAASMTNVDAYYYAFSRDPSPSTEYRLNAEEEATVAVAQSEGYVIIADVPIRNLFSRLASRLYVQDFQGETLPVTRQSKSKLSSSGIPNANSYIRPPEGMTIDEYTEAVTKEINGTVIKIKEMIYQKLVAVESDRKNSEHRKFSTLVVADEGDF